MNVFIVNPLARRAGQALFAVVCGLFVVSTLIFDILAGLRLNGPMGGLLDFAAMFVGFLALPFQTGLSPVIVLVSGLIPTVVSACCYDLTPTTPPVATDQLNRFGQVMVGVLIAGVALGLIALVLFMIDEKQDRLKYIAGGTPQVAPVKGLISAFISFESLYLLQLLGLKPK